MPWLASSREVNHHGWRRYIIMAGTFWVNVLISTCGTPPTDLSFRLHMQDMDQGVLFCTYSLLIQKSKSGKEVTQTMAGDPHGYFHPHVIDLHERAAAHEASKGELEFGNHQPFHPSHAHGPNLQPCLQARPKSVH